jgi:hypothetical protein
MEYVSDQITVFFYLSGAAVWSILIKPKKKNAVTLEIYFFNISFFFHEQS